MSILKFLGQICVQTATAAYYQTIAYNLHWILYYILKYVLISSNIVLSEFVVIQLSLLSFLIVFQFPQF